MIKEKELDRILSFSDAIVAVAITSLVLPLTDLFSDIGQKSIPAIFNSIEFISAISSLFISFFVIYGYWSKHRRIFNGVTEISNKVEKLNRLWLFTIILIPAATNINFTNQNVLGIWIYGLLLIFSTLILQKIDCKLHDDVKLFHSYTLNLLILSLVLVYIFPQLGHSVYYILFLGRPLKRIIRKKKEKEKEND